MLTCTGTCLARVMAPGAFSFPGVDHADVASDVPRRLEPWLRRDVRRLGCAARRNHFPCMLNGFEYSQTVPFDAPGPDGPRTPEYIASEIQRRDRVAAAAFRNRIWRNTMRRWDSELKPASIATHRALADVDLAELDTEGLRAHLHGCVEHVGAMWYQHHRFNGCGRDSSRRFRSARRALDGPTLRPNCSPCSMVGPRSRVCSRPRWSRQSTLSGQISAHVPC